VSRLLQVLRDKGLTDWADEALDVAALVLADRRPEDAAVALRASRPAGAGDGRLAAMRDRPSAVVPGSRRPTGGRRAQCPSTRRSCT